MRVPGDKSISHRALILGALATGRTTIRGLAPGGDCRSTRACLSALGVAISETVAPDGTVWHVEGLGLGGLVPPAAPLDAGNSGTTARFLMGVLAGHRFTATLTGDASLSRRPMRRVADPLGLMGARIDTTGGCLPATVDGPSLARDRVRDAHPQRAGQECRAAGRAARRGRHGGDRVPADPRPHRAGAGGVWRRHLGRAAAGVRRRRSTADRRRHHGSRRPVVGRILGCRRGRHPGCVGCARWRGRQPVANGVPRRPRADGRACRCAPG